MASKRLPLTVSARIVVSYAGERRFAIEHQ